MHIAVDALLVHGEFSGVQHAILHQLRGLLGLEHDHRITVVAPRDVPIEEHIGFVSRQYEVLRAPVLGSEKLKRACWQQFGLPDTLRRLGVDLLYSPGYLTSLRWRGLSVAFVHDTIALSHPDLCMVSNAVNYRLLLPASARHATLVATPSHTSARDVAHYCRVAPERIRVAPLGVLQPPPFTQAEQAALLARYGITPPFLLAVSTIEPKKNFDSLVRWFTAWKRRGIPHRLVIIGKWGWGCGPVRDALAESPHKEQIFLPGYVPQSELPPIMAAADLLLMPSRYEGFGLPALEAMAAGTPVAASIEGALPEVVNGAGLILPLLDERWITEIPELLNRPARLAAMRAAGLTWAASHTWEHTAKRLLEIFAEAAAKE